jgi:outer membrane protein
MNRSRHLEKKLIAAATVNNIIVPEIKNNHLIKSFTIALLWCPLFLLSQTSEKDSLLQEVTLKNAVNYAMVHQPKIRQSIVDEQILETTIKSKLADWYPQINFNFIQQENFLLPETTIGGNLVKLGVNHSTAGQFTFTQNIFNKDVLLASHSKDDVRLQAKQATSNNKIALAAEVSKAYYDVLATLQQIKVSEANILRIEQSLKDAYNQYKAGITDKIDYKRATISLNNSKATKRTNEELLKAKLEYLKSLMGYPVTGILNIVYDSLQMENEISLDTLQVADYSARIEYKLLSTRRNLLKYNLRYNKWSYLPTISANGAYNLNFQSNNFNQLYASSFPTSFVALNLGIPIFQGGKRKANVQAAELDLERNELDFAYLKSTVSSAYAQALAMYKSNLLNYLTLKENMGMAKEVYDIIQMQYRAGIKTYLEVITSETDLRASEINYYTALYQLLASKVDVQKELGQINY